MLSSGVPVARSSHAADVAVRQWEESVVRPQWGAAVVLVGLVVSVLLGGIKGR